MTHEEKVGRWIERGAIGVEIGAFKSPVPGLVPPPFYVDCFREFGFEPVHADYYGHATSLPFRDNSLDYVVTSHVLEHVANPVAALAEWYRVLRPGGIIYLLVPDRRHTWDHPRALTPVAHFLADYERGTTPADATHIDDFALGIDWAQFSPATPAADVATQRATLARGMHEAVARGEHLNIHFHTFEPASVLELLAQLRTWPRTRYNWRVVDAAEGFPAANPIGFLAIIRVGKSWRDRLAGWRHARATARDPKFPLRPDAQPFADFARSCAGLGGVR
jgi:SAM-dependent methyltransferase